MILQFLNKLYPPLINSAAKHKQFTLSKVMSAYKCVLECVDGTHDPIPLPHKRPVVIGRSKETQIKDSSVSREQVELTADCIRRQVDVVHIGSKASQVDQKVLQKNECAILKTGILYLAPNSYPHRAKFRLEKMEASSSSSEINTKTSRKREADFESDDCSQVKKPKLSPSRSPNKDDEEDDDDDDDDDDERVQKVAANLRLMKQKVKVTSPEKKATMTPASSDKCSDVADQQGEPRARESWTETGLMLVYQSKGLRASSKIAAFDVDGTIITTQSGKVFPTHAGDWKILYPDIPGGLKKLNSEGYKIVFITNQKGIEKGKVKVPEYKQKVENIVAKLGIPVHLLASKGSGQYRKPGLGMWKHLTEQENEDIKVNYQKSFYVGDAAGRPKDWVPGKKKDFSCGDRLFAINAELKFYTPEEYFLKKSRATYNLPTFDPRKLESLSLLVPASAKCVSGSQEVIVMVGFPASGKTQFVKEHMVKKGYVHINRDTHKTWQKCVQLCKTSLEQGKSVIVDNTNPDVESRLRYIKEAKRKKVPCRCFVHQATLERAKHNERFREMTDSSHQHISDMVMNVYKSKFAEPVLSEGFTEIVKVNFVADFKDEKLEATYRQYLMEK